MPSIDLETPPLDQKPDGDLEKVYEKSKRRASGVFSNPYTFPWWLLILVIGWIWVVYQMQANPDYAAAWRQIQKGVPLTVWLAISAYALALVLGLLMGLVRAYEPEAPDTRHSAWYEFALSILGFFRPSTYVYSSKTGFILRKRIIKSLYLGLYNMVTVYVEFMRGIPSLVFLFIATFIIVPTISAPTEAFLNVTWLPFYNTFLLPVMNGLFNHSVNLPILDLLFHPYEAIEAVRWRGNDPATGTLGLGMIYAAYLAEVFRAGIQSVPKGQVEASKSLGMTGYQTMRHIVIPQAIRNVLPPLGNDFIAMIKDTSLVSGVGMGDMSQEAKKWSGSVFTFVPTYAVLSVAYLTLTVTGSLWVQRLEHRLRAGNVQKDNRSLLSRLVGIVFRRRRSPLSRLFGKSQPK
jgi:polar amino acid transport system permease protein